MRGAIGFATVGLGAALLAQEPQTPRFRVAVDAVRIDAVVTDKDGNIVRDLTAADFELFQDGRKQPVTFAQFVPILTAAAPAPAAPRDEKLKSTAIAAAPPLLSGGAVRREHIQRTIALVVDDLGLSVESLHYVKRSLHDFIDRSLQPGDLVALVRTGGSLDGLQPFTTDARVLHAAVEALNWTAFSRSGVEAFEAINQWKTLDSHATFDPEDFTELNRFRRTVQSAGTLGALNLVIRGARPLPGRKAVLFISEGFEVLEKYAGDMTSQPGRVRAALDRAIDQAVRAGVVVYSIDARGLQTGRLLGSDNLKVPSMGADPNGNASTMESSVAQRTAERAAMLRDTQEGMAYLAEQTGGFAVLNTNDLGAGLARAAQDVRDYYVIGYVPEAHTFAGKDKTPEYHRIDVRVKRPGLKVRTRKEFFGVSDEDASAEPPSAAQALVNAAISPFTATDIAIRATLLPGFSPDRGLFVRVLLHIDASALTFAKNADGKSTAAADVLGMVFDRDGTEVAHLTTAFEAALTNEGARDALREGLAYTLRIPIPRAGAYQVRFAVRDRQSGTFGTAGEFLDLPDVPHGAFAVSGIVLRANGDVSPSAADVDRMMISPSQAVRVYRPGTQLTYACDIYNAVRPVQLTLSVWRGTQKVLSATPDTLTPPPGPRPWFSAGGAFKLGDALAPGRYILQIAAQTTDPDKKGAVTRATQVMDFDVK
jgi:VWFA-related protein